MKKIVFFIVFLTFLIRNILKMIGRKVIQVTWIAAAMMICHDARYLLVNLSGGNERASNELINPLGKMIGNIV